MKYPTGCLLKSPDRNPSTMRSEWRRYPDGPESRLFLKGAAWALFHSKVIFLYVLEGNARYELARIDEVAAGIGEPWVRCQCFSICFDGAR